MQKEQYPKVGLGVCIRKDGKMLFGRRKNILGDGTWCFPGGHLEMNEEWIDCAKRETREETGIEIDHVRFAAVTNDIDRKDKAHYVTLFLVADWRSGDVQNLEPEKSHGWKWFGMNEIPKPLLLSTSHFLASGIDPISF